MYPRDWKLFLETGHGKEIAIAQLSREMTAHLRAASEKVYLHHDYARKAVEKHRLGPEHFPLIFDTVEHGRALADREAHITFLHDTGLGWFQVTVKRAMESRRIYVATFYKTSLAEVIRKTKRYSLLRKLKWAAHRRPSAWWGLHLSHIAPQASEDDHGHGLEIHRVARSLNLVLEPPSSKAGVSGALNPGPHATILRALALMRRGQPARERDGE